MTYETTIDSLRDARLSMADAIILATARAEDATPWTQDAHFEGLGNVEFRKRQ